MAWLLVVSDDEQFQREAQKRIRGYAVVGATAEPTASGLVGSFGVDRILVDAAAETGKRFLSVLRRLPGTKIQRLDVRVVDPSGSTPRFENWPSIDDALEGASEMLPG